MLRTRVATTMLALMLVGAGPLLLPAPATGTGAEALPTRSVSSTVVKVDGNLVLKGRVRPAYVHRVVLVQKRSCKTCAWRRYRRLVTSDASRYRVRIGAPRTGAWFWRAKVPASGGYGVSYSGVWKTFQSG